MKENQLMVAVLQKPTSSKDITAKKKKTTTANAIRLLDREISKVNSKMDFNSRESRNKIQPVPKRSFDTQKDFAKPLNRDMSSESIIDITTSMLK
jgi:hypothetical protein